MALGTLYLVATPIGNLEDITLRALRVLREVSRIACEDTRQTRKLLTHHRLRTPTEAFHSFNEKQALPRLIRKLREGDNLALVTDGGTPAISDPGFSLVRAAAREGIPIVPVPGASAPLTALVVSGLPTETFSFFGFLPHRSGPRQRFLESIKDRTETLIFFDSPRRVAKSLGEMLEILGNRHAAMGREMTKVHEEFLRGTLEELTQALGNAPVRGEVTVVVTGAPASEARPADPTTLREEVEKLMRARDFSRKDAIRSVARSRKLPRREVYRAAQKSGEGPAKRD